MTTMTRMVAVAARPGVFCGFLVSSFMVRVTSQPQKMKMDSEIPAAKAEKDSTPNGLNQSAEISIALKAVPADTWPKAATANQTSTTTWNATSTYWKVLVVSMPRYEIQQARPMNTQVVA